MKDIELYHQILGLIPPWRVTGVTLKREEQSIEVEVACQEGMVWGCPECRERMHVHGYEQRRWRHLDSCQYRTYVVAKVPRVKCAHHGTQMVQVPWAEKLGRFTLLFERLAIDVLLECSIEGARDILRISWDEADGIKQRAVQRGLNRKQDEPLKRLCVDEKSAGHGQDYFTLVSHLKPAGAMVEYVGDGRTQESLDEYWKRLSAERLAGVEVIGMDLWAPYKTSTLLHVPGASGKIVHDQFHLVGYMNEAVDTVRKEEHRQLQARGDDRLKGSRQLWLYGFENVPSRWSDRMDQLRASTLKTAKAWSFKEMFRNFWTCSGLVEARAFFKDWYSGAIRSRLAPVKKVARMFRRHIENILTYFQHRLTNAAAEGLNNAIQSLVKKAYGYRNRERFKTDIYFHLGGLNLYPAVVQ